MNTKAQKTNPAGSNTHALLLVKKYFVPIFALSVFGLGVFIGNFAGNQSELECERQYQFINAHLVCGDTPVIKKTGYVKTENSIREFIEAEKVAGRLIETSVYFRDLKNGPTFGIRENADFAPASLLKLPLALVYLTQAEKNPDILKEQLSVERPQWSFIQEFPSSDEINPNAPHAVEELLMRMLVNSDNNAYGVLQTHLHETGQDENVRRTFLELGFLDPKNITDETLSVRQYAGILRGLYNGSYLNAEYSEQALGWLAQAEFKQGLRGGVPEHVVIAHKFGERFTDDGVKQLHDCGIVYYPENPYLLCVMTRGKDFAELATTIRSISKEVYTEIALRRI